MTKYYRYMAVVLCVMFFFAQPLPVNASSKSLSELEKDKNAISQEIQNTQGDLNMTQAEMKRVQQEIESLDEDLTIAMNELDIINESLNETLKLLAESEEKLEQARSDRDKQYESFKSRLRFMHENGTISFIEVLFQATGIRDFLTRLEYINSMASYDQEIVERMESAEEKVSEKVEAIAKHKNTVEILLHAQTVTTNEIQQKIEERAEYFKQLDADEDRYMAKLELQKEDEKLIQAAYQKAKEEEEARQRALAAERERQKQLAAQEAAARQSTQQANTKVTYNGSMLWPAPSSTRITDHYGSRTHPITKKKDTHTGVDIGAPMGSDIKAADSGTVILASYNGGYGNCVIIDHGGGISTLYAHASKLLVSVGQSVSKGTVIAKIGSTGVSTGPHLHFEVRINGSHTNPRPYLGY